MYEKSFENRENCVAWCEGIRARSYFASLACWQSTRIKQKWKSGREKREKMIFHIVQHYFHHSFLLFRAMMTTSSKGIHTECLNLKFHFFHYRATATLAQRAGVRCEVENEHNIARKTDSKKKLGGLGEEMEGGVKNPRENLSGIRKERRKTHFLDVIKSDLCSFKSFQRLKLVGRESKRFLNAWKNEEIFPSFESCSTLLHSLFIAIH